MTTRHPRATSWCVAVPLLVVVAGLIGCTPQAADLAGSPTAVTTPPSPSVSSADGDERPLRDPTLDQPLIRAAAAGDTARVKRLLALGARTRATDQLGRTALVAAAYGNHLGVVRALLDVGADVNTQDSSQQSAYLIATSEVGDDVRLLELMLAHGARVNAKDSFNGTGLIRAADRGYPRVVRRLLAAGVTVDHVNDLGWTALHEAIILGDGGPAYVRVVGLLIDAGADVNLASGRDGVRPLAHAVDRGLTAIAQRLRVAGARR